MKLRVSGLEFSYNSHPVLSDVQFHLEQDRIMCILGVNGAGKSTLLKCLNRILRPQRGSVLVEDRNLLHMTQNSVARHMGYVPQRQPDSRLTVFETVLMGRRPHLQWSLQDKDYEVVEHVLQELGLEALAMRSLMQLSGGEMQKVALARALAQSPDILLLDEPTSSLDLKNQLEVMGLIRRVVHTQDLSAVVAIHDLNMALRFGDSFLFLKDHRVHGIATRDDLNADVIQNVYGVPVALEQCKGQTVVVPL